MRPTAMHACTTTMHLTPGPFCWCLLLTRVRRQGGMHVVCAFHLCYCYLLEL